MSNHKIQDRLLLKKAACQGCSESLAVIYIKYRPIVYDYLKRAGADSMAEDICQSVFMRLVEGNYDYDGQASVDYYLCAAAKNILRNYRRVKSENPHPPKQIENLNAELMINVPSEPLETAEEYQLAVKLIAQLPPKSRQAIEIAFMCESKGQDAIPHKPDAFRKRLKYAIKLLRRKFNDL